jgi:hypothetical protein
MVYFIMCILLAYGHYDFIVLTLTHQALKITPCVNGHFAKYQLSDGSPLVSMVSIDENVKFPRNIRYF